MKRRQLLGSVGALASAAGCLRLTTEAETGATTAEEASFTTTNERTTTGTSSEEPPAPAVSSLRERWTKGLSAEALLSGEGSLFAAVRSSSRQGVAAFSAAEGEPHWFEEVDRLRFARLAFRDDTLFASGLEKNPSTGEIEGGVAVSLDAETGDRHWTYRVDGVAHTAVEVTDEFVFLPGNERTGRIYVIDRETGDLRWEITGFGGDASGSVSSLRAADSTLYVCALNSLHEYDLESRAFGTELDVNAGRTILEGDRLFVNAGTSVLAYDTDSLLERWRYDTPDAQLHNEQLLVRPHGVYFANGNFVTALGRSTGEERWRTEFDHNPASNPHLWRGALWIVTADDALRGLDLRDGSEFASTEVSFAGRRLASTRSRLFVDGQTITAFEAE